MLIVGTGAGEEGGGRGETGVQRNNIAEPPHPQGHCVVIWGRIDVTRMLKYDVNYAPNAKI